MRRLLWVVGLIGIWWWLRGDRVRVDTDVQAAVLKDGFAVRSGQRVVDIDRKGNQRKQYSLEHTGDVRLLGPASGTAAVWIESKKVRLVRLATGKSVAVFGQSARMLCEGAATNDERFAAGWLEADDSVWFVHGDTRVKRSDEASSVEIDEPVMVPATADRKNWCGIASAQDLIALFWRDRDRLLIQTCTRKKCAGIAGSVAFDRNDTLLGFGCVRNACLLAARGKQGKSRLQFVTESGSTKWTKELDITQLEVAIIGAGPDAFAIGYSTAESSDVLRVDRKGSTTRVWHGPPSGGAPALAWSNGQLLVAPRGGQSTLVAFPK
ncbi:MAG TPA: hypothetical protein VIV40_00590 [Kofleriaceae bacterium]